nr:uncharacterized protein LOC113804657 [Penaeus vannamei]
MAYRQKFGSMDSQQCIPNFTNSLCAAGNRVNNHKTSKLVPAVADHHLPEGECSFRASSGTAYMIFILRHHQEKCRTQNKGLYVIFVGLTEAFDISGLVRNSKDFSEPFPIITGVKQGCMLVLTLFTIFFSMMLQWATQDHSDEDGIYIQYRTDIETAIQRATSCFAAVQLFGLEINQEKTEVLHQPTPPGSIPLTLHHCWRDRTEGSPAIHLPGEHHLKDVDNRLAKANSALGRFYSHVWSNNHLKKATKSVFTELCDYVTNVGVRKSRDHQPCHANENVAMLNKICFQNGGSLSAQDRPLRRTTRDTKEEIQRFFREIPVMLRHRPSSEGTACFREAWRHAIQQLVSSFENNYRAALEEKRSGRKKRVVTAPTPDSSFPCSHCGRVCLAHIGLVSLQ